MKNLILFLALFLSVLTLSATTTQPQKNWEYKFEYKCSDKKANDFASQGWELLTVTSVSYSGMPMELCAFRRPK